MSITEKRQSEGEIMRYINGKKIFKVKVERPSPGSLPMNEIDVKNSYILPTTGSRGLALLLNIAEFVHGENVDTRSGSEKDMQFLTDLFTQLDYKVWPEKEHRESKRKTKMEMIRLISQFKERCNNEKPESIIVFVGSHGRYPFRITTTEEGEYLELFEDIVYQFSHKNCPGLKGKPKLFLIQACQKFRIPPTATNLPRERQLLLTKDTSSRIIEDALICAATIPGEPSKRNTNVGSRFIFCLTYQIMKHALKMRSLQDILALADEMLKWTMAKDHFEQVPLILSLRFNKKFYFSGTQDYVKYCRLPSGLANFIKDDNYNFCILQSMDNKTTLEKIYQKLDKPYRFLQWPAFQEIVDLPPKDGCRESEVLIVKDVNVENLMQLHDNDEIHEGFRKIVFVTCGETQTLVMQRPWMLCSDEMNFEDLRFKDRLMIKNKLEQTYNVELTTEEICGQVLLDVVNGNKLNLYKETLPEELSYYIRRTLIARNKMTSEILGQDDSQDVFFVRDIQHYELSKLCKGKTIVRSSEFLDGNFANYIVMDLGCQDHFKKICSKVSTLFKVSKNVHLLQYEDGILRWVQSRGNIKAIQKYIASPASQEKESEEGFCFDLDPDLNQPICIADSPGMGKSVVLGKIGRILKATMQDRHVIFMGMRELIEKIRKCISGELPTIIKKVLQETLCQNLFEEAIIGAKLKSNGISIELLLDGLDEIDSADLQLGYDVLKSINTSIKSIRLWITTRSHFLEDLEKMFNTLGYNIQPFAETDQVNFLTSFWEDASNLDDVRTEKFARHCLNSLKEKMNSDDEDIAGIPLQCRLIAEVYEGDVLSYSIDNSSDPLITINSMADLYRRLVDKDIDRQAKGDKARARTLMDMHVKLALDLIVPEHKDKYEKLFSPVDMDDVFRVGIVKSASINGKLEFIHRTFAEYFVAWLLVDRLDKVELIDIFMGAVLNSIQIQLSYIHSIIPQIKITKSVVGYFINVLIENITIEPSHVIHHFINYSVRSKAKKLLEIAQSCARADHVHIFKFLDVMGVFNQSEKKIFCKELLFLTIQNAGLEFVRLVLDRFERHNKLTLKLQGEILILAVERGVTSIVNFLLNERDLRRIVEAKTSTKKTRRLLHKCLSFSASAPEIAQKVEVIQMLVEINPHLLEYTDSDGNTPLVANFSNVHLLLKLISLDANVLARNKLNDANVLHISLCAIPWHLGLTCNDDFLRLLTGFSKNNLRRLADMRDNLGDTPLIRLIKLVDPLPETLNLLRDGGTDFNAMDGEGDSVLVAAIKCGRNVDTIRTLINCGANPEMTGVGQGESILHVAAHFGNVEVIEYLVNAGINVNSFDLAGLRPLDYAMMGDPSSGKIYDICSALHDLDGKFEEIDISTGQSCLHAAAEDGNLGTLQFLVRVVMMNVNAKDVDGNTPLHLVMRNRRHTTFSIVTFLLDNNAHPDILNEIGETPFLLAVKHDQGLDFETFQLLKSKTVLRWTPEIATLILKTVVKESYDLSDSELNTLFRELFDQGADSNYVDDDGEPLLLLAASEGNRQVIRLLVEANADVRAVNKAQQTALHVAARGLLSNIGADDYIHIIKYLIAEGADVYAMYKGGTFLHYFIAYLKSLSNLQQSKFHSMADYLIEKGYSSLFQTPDGSFGEIPLYTAILRLDVQEETLFLLRSTNVNFNTVNKYGDSILAYAIVGMKAPSFLSMLIEKFSAELKHLNSNKESLLHIAARSGSLEVLKFLLDSRKLEVNHKNLNGNTALHVALEAAQNGIGKNVFIKCKLLLSLGADVNILNLMLVSPLQMIKKMEGVPNQKQIVRLFSGEAVNSDDEDSGGELTYALTKAFQHAGNVDPDQEHANLTSNPNCQIS